MGRAFSIHTFMGSAGSALAPAVLIALTGLWNWRVAVMIVSLVGIAMAMALISQMDALKSDRAPRAQVSRRRKPGQPKPPTVGARVLLTPPVLVLFLFFLATTLPTSGIQTFSVMALITLHDLPLATASSALTGYLVAVAAGVLIGGVVADRTTKHDRMAVFAFLVTAAVLALVGEVRFEIVGLVTLFALMGVLQGTVRPARDMMVREITPRGTRRHHLRLHVDGAAAGRDGVHCPVRMDHRHGLGALAVLAVRRGHAGGPRHPFHAAHKDCLSCYK